MRESSDERMIIEVRDPQRAEVGSRRFRVAAELQVVRNLGARPCSKAQKSVGRTKTRGRVELAVCTSRAWIA